ncbi:hypothetical protein [Neoroseomonas soli]|uniref:Lipoprotein n=1 Tax=Neoroseomonas soli TaxID=1081025 RepID=A0A9X9X3B4_9PROT|nr:hypothetical protein [Neoroseomonas soli]MBR0673893.1 hypothetical protein [Neoroseomonas soli]
MSLSRRAALSAALAAAACGRASEPPPPPSAPPSYSHLTPLRLAVGRIEVVAATDPAATRTMPPAPLVPQDVVLTMARDRLAAGGGTANARFRVQIATLTREGAGAGGVFTTATERLTCTLRCRLEVVGEDGSPAGFAEAEVRRAAVRPAGSPAERTRAAEEIVRQAGNDLNVEFEYQMRRNLRALIQAPPRPGEAVPPPVEAEPLPRT